MDKDTFMLQVSELRQQGSSIRGIASKLGVHPSRVQRAVAKLPFPGTDPSEHKVSIGDQGRVFVGREEELDLLQGTLDEAIAGHGNIVFLSGEPGIGKTRLVKELCSYAESRKVSSYWGRCYEELETPPYWPWIQIFRNYIQHHKASLLRSEMGTAAADIAALAPKLVQNPKLLEKLPDLKPGPPLNNPSEDRFRLFDSVSSFFKRSSKRQPMLLLLDNLQWSDKPSLLFLRFISQELASTRILIVGTYRNIGQERNHRLTATLGELSRHPFFRHMKLHGLNQQETEQLIGSHCPAYSSKEIMEAVYNRTGGNPLFIIHIVQSLIKESQLVGKESAVDLYRLYAIPDSLRLAIARNLEYLSPRCRKILTMASAIGPQFNLLILQRTVKNLTAPKFQDFLNEAVHGGIIVPKKALGTGWYQFTHTLVQEVLLRETTAKQRTKLHASIGLALEEMYGNDVTSYTPNLAYHFTESADLTGFDKAIYYSKLAAEQALSVFANEEAVLHFHRALMIKRKKTPSASYGIPDSETAEILLGLVKAGATTSLWSTHASFEAVLHLLDYYIDRKDVLKIIEIVNIPIVIGDQSKLFESRNRFERIFSLLPSESLEAGWLMCIYGYFLGTYSGEPGLANDAFDRALAIASQHGDKHMEMRALINSVLVKAAHWKVDWVKLEQIIDMAKRLEDKQVEALGKLYYAAFSINTKQRGEAQGLWDDASLAVNQLGHHILQDSLTSTGQILAQYYGDFHGSPDPGELIKVSDYNILDTMIRAIGEYELGRFEEGDRFVWQAARKLKLIAAGHSPECGYAAAQFPFIKYLTGREEWSEIEDEIINEVLNSVPPENFLGIMARVGLGIRAINNCDIIAAQKSYDFLKTPLKEYPERSMIPPVAMSSDRLLGLLCLTFEDYDRAIRHFQDAIELCRGWTFLPQMAWSCYDCARARLLRNQPHDMSKAKTIAGEALSMADELGMKLLAGRINSLQEIKIYKQVSSTDSNNFTDREIEVLMLLAKGRSNREIAEELFMSTNTAATHVRNILCKGNLANRAEAAALAVRYYAKAQ